MNNGKFTGNSIGKVLISLLLVSVVILCAALYFTDDSGEGTDPHNVTQTEQTDTKTDPTDRDPVVQPGLTTGPDANDPPEAQTKPSEPDQTEIEGTSPPATIGQQAEAEYERWLAAALVVGVSMEYPDFIPDGIYTTSATAPADKFSSDGVYIVFTSGGAVMAIHSKPIPGERSEAGTMDLSSEAIGFATFDPVDSADIDFDSMDRIALEDLSELIAQSLLISIYAR